MVGAPLDDDNGINSGSAYVFVRSGSTWSQQQKLTASDGATLDVFGASVAVSGDTTVVGSWYDDDNGTDSGSAYVFVVPAPPTPVVPGLSQWGLVAMAGLLAVTFVRRLRRTAARGAS